MSSRQSTTRTDDKSRTITSHPASDPQSPDLTSALSPFATLQRANQNPGSLKPREVVQLQRLIGNHATTRLLAQRYPKSAAFVQRQVGSYAPLRVRQGMHPVVQRAIMSAKEFKEATYVRWHRRNKIAKIDALLKKVEQTGADSMNLTELKNEIEKWLRGAEANSPRRPTVELLREQVQDDLDQIAEELTPEMDEDVVPTTRGRSNAMSATIPGTGRTYGSDFSDFDSKQFRVSGRAPFRKVEEVKRTENDDGTITYYAMGLVTGFRGKIPVIAPYPQPISLGEWYPQVTHINGMNVAPKSGIQSAQALQEGINSAIGGDEDVAMGQDAIDVLYTYSAQRGNPAVDVWDCIKGKLGIDDEATERQQEIMLDAINNQRRVTVSAHSRGSIKTDNAVRNVFKIVTDRLLPDVRSERRDEVIQYWEQNDPGIGLDPEALAELSYQGIAEEKAKATMNQYIQLIYAGNAVQYPSSAIQPTMFVGGLDPVSMFVGSYTSTFGGTTSVGKTKGHSFVGNYVPAVSQAIANDIRQRDEE